MFDCWYWFVVAVCLVNLHLGAAGLFGVGDFVSFVWVCCCCCVGVDGFLFLVSLGGVLLIVLLISIHV